MTSHNICENIKQIKEAVENVELVVVSKYRSLEELETVYACGHRHFGENRVQELVARSEALPQDIQWHAIGHLQTNKVKYIAPFVHLIHSVDSLKLAKVINKEAEKVGRTIPFLFQVHIAEEETKFGLSFEELNAILSDPEFKELDHIQCVGLMGMATNTTNEQLVASEFSTLNAYYSEHKEEQHWQYLSMGMSGDFHIAVQNGSNMIRVGSKIFAD